MTNRNLKFPETRIKLTPEAIERAAKAAGQDELWIVVAAIARNIKAPVEVELDEWASLLVELASQRTPFYKKGDCDCYLSFSNEKVTEQFIPDNEWTFDSPFFPNSKWVISCSACGRIVEDHNRTCAQARWLCLTPETDKDYIEKS